MKRAQIYVRDSIECAYFDTIQSENQKSSMSFWNHMLFLMKQVAEMLCRILLLYTHTKISLKKYKELEEQILFWIWTTKLTLIEMATKMNSYLGTTFTILYSIKLSYIIYNLLKNPIKLTTYVSKEVIIKN